MEVNDSHPDPEGQNDSTAGYTLGNPKDIPTAGAEPELQLETVIDNDYLILSKIGPGGCGVVYKARQRSISRDVALKLIRPDMAAQLGIERFQKEIETLGKLNHPNIVHVITGGKIHTSRGSQPYFTMEYIDGLPVTRYADKQKLSVEKRLDLFLQICEAIAYAHERGVIHRDIKPSNILVTEKTHGEPFVKVIDFGIAKLIDGDRVTQTGQVVGTPEYMSPEQADAASKHSVNETGDIYSLGVLLHELLIGFLPINPAQLLQNGSNQTIKATNFVGMVARLKQLEQAEQNRIALLRSTDPNAIESLIIKGGLSEVVTKCLAPDSVQRYQTVAQLTNDIALVTLKSKNIPKEKAISQLQGESSSSTEKELDGHGEVKGHADETSSLPASVHAAKKVLLGTKLEEGEILYLDTANWLVTNRRLASVGLGFAIADVRGVETIENRRELKTAGRIYYFCNWIGILGMVAGFYYGASRKVGDWEIFAYLLLGFAPGWLLTIALKKTFSFKAQLKLNCASGSHILMESSLKVFNPSQEEEKNHNANLDMMNSLSLAIGQAIANR